MSDIERAAFLNSQVACAMIEAMGLHAENMQRQAVGNSMAYDEAAFVAIIEKYGIGHNAALSQLTR